MPSINRIRVNNVKYNFGTQQYDDFSMRMYGKNTLYDLANGGGKSILMLLLLQNLIPNCTLDDKQPVEKLFRAGGGNTTIHSLVEWKLDEADIVDGYKYMTTGFCARKAKDAPDEGVENKDTASIEYFNYCIFYRTYNKNDIVNLPLSEGNEKITFSGLKTYLKELSHKDLGLEIKIFERKGEYQRFISQYGLHESHWEIIRGINKTEGHVRTYFETNYKTTRKVVEDLLIEEIIEKAFATKTGRNGEEDTMAETLLDIKDKLNVLAQKKRDIVNYDHQIELINVLEDKVNSCIGLYEEYAHVANDLADVYVTGREYHQRGDQELARLLEDKNRKFANKENQKLRLANLKITRDYFKLDELEQKIKDRENQIKDNASKLKELKAMIAYKESVNDYISYKETAAKYQENKLIVENIMNNMGDSTEKMVVYAYNKKLRNDVNLKKLLEAKAETEKSLDDARTELEYSKKLLREGEITEAVSRNNLVEAEQKIAELSAQISKLTAKVSLLAIGDAGDMYQASMDKKAELSDKLSEIDEARNEVSAKLYNDRYELTICEAEYESVKAKAEEFEKQAERFRELREGLDSIMAVYGAENPDDAVSKINARIAGTITETVKREQKIEELKQELKAYKNGKCICPSEGVKIVLDYIASRHGHMAMHGADYIAALPENTKDEILSANPSLPYGVVTKGYSDIEDDINLKNINTGNECVCVYDMDKLSESAIKYADNMVVVGRGKSFFMDPETAVKLSGDIEIKINDLSEEIKLINEKLSTYQEDLVFVSQILDARYMDAEENERMLHQSIVELKDKRDELRRSVNEAETLLKNYAKDEEQIKIDVKSLEEDTRILYHMDELYGLLKKEEDKRSENKELLSGVQANLDLLRSETIKWSTNVNDSQTKLDTISKNIENIQSTWEEYYAPYAVKADARTEILSISDQELESQFMAMYALTSKNAPDIEDKKKLMEVLEQTMSRIVRTIEKRGVDINELKAEQELYPVSEEALTALDEEIARLGLIGDSLSQDQKNDNKAFSKLEGSIEYAIAGVYATYGEGSYKKEDITPAEAENAISHGDQLLKDLELAYKESVNAYDVYYKEQGFMTDLYKDVKRIVDTNEIDVRDGRILDDHIDALRQSFENSLLRFDRSRKQLDKAKNELMKFKGQTAEALLEMGMFEMSQTIRQDVAIPDTYDEAKMLLSNLLQITEFIRLEKERVEKGIEDMVAIKDNFENQCIQRCMDVKTELEKLPKLSRITVGEDVIKMVDLTIPYVKEEFLKQRMSDYIDSIVKNADTYEDEKKRIKFIRDMLCLKRLFGVVVTDMNAIKLNLYKRERIREQSRYLKYEEAVGSTGQSQGIYIQFLVAVINYIAGMYSYGPEDSIQTKSIFIDNPFGAAKDIYIWEPIFAMLAANNVQLIVPARGATPAITGRFDVNYILGQQMVGGKQQTVVVSYNSKTDQEELEYQELSYEQASFDFI